MIICGLVALAWAILILIAYRWIDACSLFYDGHIVRYDDAPTVGRGPFRRSLRPVVIFAGPGAEPIEFVETTHVDRPYRSNHAVRVRVFRGRPRIHDRDWRFFALLGPVVSSAVFFGVAALQHFDPDVIDRWFRLSRHLPGDRSSWPQLSADR